MAFNGTEGAFITLAAGADMTANYRNNPNGGKIAHFFGKDKLQDLIDLEGSMGIRFYYGVDDDGKQQLVAVAADANQNDILSLVLDQSKACPTWCSNKNELNCDPEATNS